MKSKNDGIKENGCALTRLWRIAPSRVSKEKPEAGLQATCLFSLMTTPGNGNPCTSRDHLRLVMHCVNASIALIARTSLDQICPPQLIRDSQAATGSPAPLPKVFGFQYSSYRLLIGS